MKRVKKNIVVIVPILKDDTWPIIYESAADAYQYADGTVFMMTGTGQPPTELQDRLMRRYGAHLIVNRWPGVNARARTMSHRSLRQERFGDPDRETIAMYLEVGWRISEPDKVRSAIEFNQTGILTAMRYFQWDEDNYRIDAQYRPARLPIAGAYLMDAHWDDPFTTAPTWMWAQRTRWNEAPFYIIDTTFTNPEYRVEGERPPKLSPIHERTFV